MEFGLSDTAIGIQHTHRIESIVKMLEHSIPAGQLECKPPSHAEPD
ncbi:MAG: hypothetical protein VB948_04575 [Pseudomonadales bacterium]